MDKQVSHDDTCMLAKLPVSHWKPLFSLPNRTDMGHGGNLTSWHRARSVESMFFFFAVTCPRCLITQLYLFAYFNHWGGNPLPAVTTAWIQARQMNRMEYSGSWSNLMLLVFSSIMKCRSAGLPKAPRRSCRLPNSSSTLQISSTSEILSLLPMTEHSQHHPRVQRPSCMCEYDHSMVITAGDLYVLSSVVPQTDRRVGTRQIRLYTWSLVRGSSALPLKR